MRYEQFCAIIRQEGRRLKCFTACKNYEEFGWYVGIFEVDKFGGSACEIKNVAGQWLFSDFNTEKHCSSLQEALSLVPAEVERERSVRCTDDLYDFINSQHD